MIPFTVDQFLQVFEQYNQAIWPMHIVAYMLGIATVILAASKIPHASQAISIVLAAYWGWMGIVYHLMYFSTINQAAYGFGTLFIIQAVLWLFYGIVRPKLEFHMAANASTAIGLALIAYAMIIYPLIGALLGHGYPQSPSFGVAPCPTTIFTFGLLLCTKARIPKPVLIIPFLWSLIGFIAAIALGIREDIGLLLAGVLSVALLVWRDRPSAPARERERYAA